MDKILLGHGSGGKLMHELIGGHFGPAFGMSGYGDSAILDISINPERLAFTTDSYVVSPIFFPGGNIGELAVYGTVNDLSMVGARPLYLSSGFIIEEGFSLSDLKTIVSAMAKAAEYAGVRIVAGDTKVVNKGKGDGIFINTAGIGLVPDGVEISSSRIRKGDKVLISGEIGNHGIAVMAERNGISFDPPVVSDTKPLNGLVSSMLGASKEIHFMRDPTRGGLATTLKEAAKESGLCIRIREDSLPVPGQVKGACELLGFDPLYIANEGILVAVVASADADPLISAMKRHPYGANAWIIGEVENSPEGMVLLETSIGGTRILDMLLGEQLPRIC
ncbi:MAG TPA: hydrogenase expression/formation protein HypE [Thermodesulfovibrionales bacterium]|nr:hydrogenase expression/formation protein HypE [Thermodesulfovibrionales bacterium]